MGHVVLLGDSIFDNARYVPDGPPVSEQVRQALPEGWRVTLLAVDGEISSDVARQLRKLPSDSTHLIASAGGNDALAEIRILEQRAGTVGAAMRQIQESRIQFEIAYRAMVRALREPG